MTTPLAVANLALAHLAVGRPIGAVNEATQSARVIKQYYEQARDEVLRDANWPFARRFASLVLAGTNPTPDWRFSYRYPDECLFVRDVYSGSRRPLTPPGPNFVSSTDDLATAPWAHFGSGTVSAANAVARYVGRPFSRISNANGGGIWAQLMTLPTSGTYRLLYLIRSDGIAGTVRLGLLDSTAGAIRGDVTVTTAVDLTITLTLTAAGIATLQRLPGADAVYALLIEVPSVVGGHSHTLYGSVGGTASSFLLSGVEFYVGASAGRVPYIVGGDDSGRLIYASTVPLQTEYTVAVDEENWPPDFAAALSFLLAWYAAPTLAAGDPNKLGERARAAYEEAIARAQLAGENEQEEDLSVANLALLHLGVGRTETAPGDQLRAMRAVRQLFTRVRDETFRAYNWPFARKFASLALVAGPTPRASTDYAYSYRYPADCLNAHQLRTGPQRPPASGPESRVPFTIGQDSSGRLIFTDTAVVAASGDWAAFPELEYTVLVDVSMWPPDFLAAVAAALAWQAAPFVLKGDARQLRERLKAEYDVAIGRAWRAHLTEQEGDPEPDSSFINARN